jgi:hypothetical protein
MKLKIALIATAMLFSVNLIGQGHSGPSPQQWNWPTCIGNTGIAEAFALGDVRADGTTIDEHSDMLEIATPVFPALCVATIQYVTTVAHNVQGVDMQMGSGLNAIMEWAMWLDIYTPDGHQYRLRMQFDKHTDMRGNQVRYFPVQWNLPVGTLVVIRRPAVSCVGIPNPGMYNPSSPSMFSPYDPNICITGQSVTFVGK